METGRLFVVSAPSGAGKTSLVKALLIRAPELSLSVSHTTRAPRPSEVDGREYHFVPAQTFKDLAQAGGFLEHAQVFDNYYGTGRQQVEAKLAAGRDVILEIDWQGARQVRKAMPACRSIFILPPSTAALRERLERRSTDSAAVIARRLADAVTDMSHWEEFDYVVVNDRFEDTLEQLVRIVQGHGAAYETGRAGLQTWVRTLLAS
jgi:guanylate kinase